MKTYFLTDVPIINELRVGDRVIGFYYANDGVLAESYRGVVYSVSGKYATIKRDDGINGGGDDIPGYGCGYHVERKASTWGSNVNEGLLCYEEPILKRRHVYIRNEIGKKFSKAEPDMFRKEDLM